MSVSSKQIKLVNRLEEAIMRYADNTPLWIKDKTGQEADPWQIIEIDEIEKHLNSLVIWPPRFGKTWGMEAVNLKELATNPEENLMIFGPKQDQANNALREHLNWIETSEILRNFVAERRGKRQLSETKYEFWNRSRAKTFGMLSYFDSEEASIIRGEEWDDINPDIWRNRVIARGGRKNRSGLPTRFRLSGTIQEGKGNMFRTENEGIYHVVTKFDVYDGIAFGIYDENAIENARREMTDDEWLRIYLLIYTEAKNFIWESYLRDCIKYANEIGWEGIEYIPGKEYHPRGTVYAGFDCGHSGQKKVHSVYRLDLIETYGDKVLWLNGKEWDSTEDPSLIRKDVADWWGYYQVKAGYGDALKANDIAEMNDALFDQGLIRTDRSKNPENKPSDWDKWDFSPKWNSGKNKYLWAIITKGKIENRQFILPYFDRRDDRSIAQAARHLERALLNIRIVINNTSYPSLEIIKPEIGDDPFDALNMAMGCANDRQIMPIDFSEVKTSPRVTATRDLRTSVLNDLQGVGREAEFRDFIN